MANDSPTQRLPIAKAVEYLKETHNIKVTKTTIYSWIEKGIKGRVLKFEEHRRPDRAWEKMKYIIKGELDEFATYLLSLGR